jgi:two-component system phosphate regulon sensor histidine kinase PhoR
VCEILDATRRSLREESRECRLAPSSPGRGETVLELRASPLRDGGGQASGAVALLHDVTALRKLETVRRDFVANVGHELKTPLTAIRGLVETMLDDRQMPADTARSFLEKIRGQSQRLSALVTDLLTLARIESNEVPLERKLLDLRAVVREGAERFRVTSVRRGLELAAELPPEPVPLDADEESLRQILDNLLDNACKYTPPGGRIRVRVARADGEVGLEVEDTGIGIAPADQERVFERFYRVDKARSRELGGTGLGLAIVKHLTQSLGGQVSLASEPGRGSTFRVLFPGTAGAARAP